VVGLTFLLILLICCSKRKCCCFKPRLQRNRIYNSNHENAIEHQSIVDQEDQETPLSFINSQYKGIYCGRAQPYTPVVVPKDQAAQLASQILHCSKSSPFPSLLASEMAQHANPFQSSLTSEMAQHANPFQSSFTSEMAQHANPSQSKENTAKQSNLLKNTRMEKLNKNHPISAILSHNNPRRQFRH
jgi:hypothetical protein